MGRSSGRAADTKIRRAFTKEMLPRRACNQTRRGTSQSVTGGTAARGNRENLRAAVQRKEGVRKLEGRDMGIH